MVNMPNAPLVYMIGMVRFPKVPELARFVPGFHDAIRSDYPLWDEVVTHATNTHIDPGGVRLEHVEAKIWQFAAPDKSFAFFLGDEFLGLHTASYRDHQDFAGRFEMGLQGLLRVPDIKIAWVVSVGIRYINVIVPKPPESLAQYLQPQALPIPIPSGDSLLRLQESLSVAAYQTSIGTLRIQIVLSPQTTIAPELDTPLLARNGWKPARPEGEFALLDIDHGTRFDPPVAMEALSIRRQIVDLRATASVAFDSVSTDFARNVWESPV